MNRLRTLLIACFGAAALAACASTPRPVAQPASPTQGMTPISREDVHAAQVRWCEALVSISAAHAAG